uniref:Seipin n=1 Tax=Graphocephala atropunctata TaxID=36148 RepID=A0A1B6KSS0_9HEMI
MFLYFPYKMRFVKMVTRRVENCRRKTKEGVELLWDSIFKGGLFGLIIATIVWVSIFLYIVFYYVYMPSLSHTRQVHLQFTACEAEKGVCSFPSAHVQLTKKQQLLMIGQRYKIFLNLEMPESPANIDLGMFMVCARMVDKKGVLVSNSCRSTMLHYRSLFLKFLHTCVHSPFFLLGSKEEKQTVMVELYSDFEEHQGHPVTDIYLEVQSRFIELYSATLHIQAHLSGLRYLMFHWPLLAALLGVSSNLFILAFVFSLSWYHLYMAHEHGRTMFVDFIRKSITSRSFRRRAWGGRDYVEDLGSGTDKQSESSSENDDSKSSQEFFKPGTSDELGYYLDGED